MGIIQIHIYIGMLSKGHTRKLALLTGIFLTKDNIKWNNIQNKLRELI